MLTSARWINDYLDPPATADEQATLLTRAGFPLEGREDVDVDGTADQRQDFEMTSNRGDCVSHVGLAREIAAISNRSLALPATNPPSGATDAAGLVKVTNHEKRRCPLYTARVIRGATVGPSPAWLSERLRARGDIPRNNVVDATNFVLFELGQPTHIFDLGKLKDGVINIRMARPDEPFMPIGEGESEVKLSADDLVIADARDTVALAGVKGGAITAVGPTTTDLLLEAASFDPVSVRTSSRRHGIVSDSSYRFERGVAPGQVHAAADRLAALVLEIAGGELCAGVVEDGAAIPPPRVASMRPDRCRRILGVPVTDEQMIDALARLGFAPSQRGDRIECVIPVHRLDIEREIDLIEEVGRMYGHDHIPVEDTVRVRVAPLQPTELAREAVANELVAMGFIETITHSLVTDDIASTFLPAGATPLRVEDDRAKGEAVLQPSALTGVLRVRRHNQDNGVDRLRLFESAAAFWDIGEKHEEIVQIGLLMDVEDESAGLRPMRGVLQRLVEVLLGHEAQVTIGADSETPWLAAGAHATVGDTPIGRLGRLADGVARQFGLDAPVLVAEVDLMQFYDRYPPLEQARTLPTFPAIERDLSPIVAENVTWAQVEDKIGALGLDHLDGAQFITTFRGGSIPSGQKSLTFRLRFRAPDRTLKHEEVSPQMERVARHIIDDLGAVFRDREAGDAR